MMMTKEKVKVRIPVLLTTMTMVALLLVGNSNSATSTAVRLISQTTVAPELSQPAEATPQGATRFSSAYTALTKCGSGMTKKEEKEAESHGSDIPTRCKSYGGYDVYIYYSACSSIFSLEKGEESIPLGMQAVGWNQKTVEWRLANGKPFAFIMRVYDYAGNDECAMAGKITGESLIARGTQGL